MGGDEKIQGRLKKLWRALAPSPPLLRLW